MVSLGGGGGRELRTLLHVLNAAQYALQDLCGTTV